MARKKTYLFLGLILFSLVIFNIPAYSAQIKSVQSQVTHFSETDSIHSSSLSNPVDTHNSFTLQSSESCFFNAFLKDSSTLDISRSLRDDKSILAEASLGSYVVEYKQGIKVIRGITTVNPKVYTKDILLPETIDNQKVFVLISVSGDVNHSNKTQTQFFKATFPDSNTLRLQRLDLPFALDSSNLYVSWQVIELETDVRVISGTASIPYNASRAVIDLSLSPIQDINKAFLVFNYTAGAGVNGLAGLLMVRGAVTDVNTLTFNRAAIGSTIDQNIDIAWYVVELTDSASNVQRGNTAIPAGYSSINVPLNPRVDITRAFGIISTSGIDSTMTIMSDSLVRAEITQTIAPGDTFTLSRSTSTAAVEIDWFLVELAPLTVKSPDGEEIWQVGEVENILWSYADSLNTGGGSPNGHHQLDILLSQDGGVSFPLTIVKGIDATSGFYAWTIPDELSGVSLIGGKLKLRLIDADLKTHNYDDSNNNFKIIGAIDLVVPIGGEVWRVGDTDRDIVWHKKGDLSHSNFVIRLSENSGLTYDTLVVDGLTQSDVCVGDRCGWLWSPMVPDRIGSDRRIKVYLADDPGNVYDVSDSDFFIKGKLQIISPNGNEEWETETTQRITWNKWGSFNKVLLYYSSDGGESFDYITTDAVPAGSTYGFYDWDIPVKAATDFSRIKIVSQQEADIQADDISDADFKIMRAMLKITYPNRGDEVWFVGDSQTITWQVDGEIDRVHCWYVKDEQDPIRITPRAGVEADQGDGNGSFTWSDIPDEFVGENVYIMVARQEGDIMPGSPFDTNDHPFSIKGKLRLISPNGGEVYTVDSSGNISWDAQGLEGKVRIRFARNGIDFDTVITPEPDGIPASSERFVWVSIPDLATSKAKIRVELISDPDQVYDDSDDYFSIKGSLTLTAPNGGEVFYINESTDITWDTVGTIGNLDLYYSVDGGLTYPVSGIIASAIAQAAMPFTWIIPDQISNQVRVKIAAVDDETIFDTSDSDFAIKGKLFLITPNGTEQWQAGTQEKINWKRLGRDMGEAKLEYSINNGADGYPHLIATGISSSDMAYSWQIPEVVGTQLKIKITLLDDVKTFDTSDDVFTIKGRIVLLIPEGGEVWQMGTQENISWVTYGAIDKVNLYYSTDGGVTYPVVIAQGISNVDGYLHTIPDIVVNKARVKVESFYDDSIYATSTYDSIIKGRLEVTSPNAGEVWQVGKTQDITWKAYGDIAYVKLEYSTDGGTSFPNLIVSSINALTGEYSWVIPDAIGSQLKVKITDISDNTIYDTSDSNFEICSLTLTSPNGGELLGVGTRQNITWTKSGSIADVRLDYSTDAGASFPKTIASSIPAGALSFTWIVPDEIFNTVRVRISDPQNSSLGDISDENFTICARFDIISPDRGEVWTVGSTHDITWKTIGTVSAIRLDYSTNGGETFAHNITTAITNTGSFSWTIPDAISAQVKVKVSDYEDSDSFAISQANFKIRGGITINSPDGGEVWIVGAQHNITWSIVGSIAQVRLEYSTDGGWAYPYIIATAVDANLGIYAWVVPDTLSRECRVKITDVLDPTVYDTSDNNFQIQGDLILVSPNGQEEWEVGSTQNITWIRRGSIQKINIEYSTDGGLTFPHKIIESLDVSTEAGSYAWVVADAISEQVRVRISDSSDAAVYDVSDADFKIKGALAISSPNAGEVWQVGSSKDIAWELTGSIGIVKLEYSTNGGLSYPHIISPSIDAALETYSWIIPDSISHQARVRITDFSDASVYDTSDNDFKIIGRLILTSPNGGEVWPVGSSQAITWNKSGSIDKVKLEYSTDGGLSFPHLIIDSISSSLGSYNWVIPDVISQTIRVKITNVNDSVVYDTSDNNFKIRGGLILNAPNGGEDWVVGSLHNITWIRFGSIADVRLDYSVDAGKSYPYTIASSVDAAGEKYNWTIPDNPGFLTRVKISDASDITVYDTSDDNFIIRTGFTLTVPNGNEAWIVGSTHDIIWDRIGPVENVKLEYSSNGGLTFVPIVSSTSNTGFYSWVIPDTITTQALVRISDVDDSTISDTSDYFFKIQGGFILTSPNGNEVWLVGDRQEITWNCTGDIKFVKLEYSTDSGLTYSLIEDNLTNDGKYSWQIPDSVAGNMLVRVSDTNDPEAFDISDADFRIRCAFTLINPNGGEVWKVGRKYNISWVNIGNIPSVKLEYSRDNFVADVKTIASDAPSYKPYSWTIPDAIFDSVKVRVSDPNDPGAFDDSDTDFRIIGDFTIITPNGGEVWQAGQIKEITWLWKGSIPQVKIEYSTDGGATFSIISATDNTGTYTWRVPDEISDEFVVRISDLVDPGVYDDSDTYAQISAGL